MAQAVVQIRGNAKRLTDYFCTEQGSNRVRETRKAAEGSSVPEGGLVAALPHVIIRHRLGQMQTGQIGQAKAVKHCIHTAQQKTVV